MKEGDRIPLSQVLADQHFTEPPPRYSEASLVKALEEYGIGRPSTYASIISTIQDRKYVEKVEGRFLPTETGRTVNDFLLKGFPDLLDTEFTSHMEEQLDKIEEQHLNWQGVLGDFYGPFKQNLETAQERMTHAKAESTPGVMPVDSALARRCSQKVHLTTVPRLAFQS